MKGVTWLEGVVFHGGSDCTTYTDLDDPMCQSVRVCWHGGSALLNEDRLGYVDEDFAKGQWEKTLAAARLMAAAPELLDALRCCLADLEGIMPEFEPNGDRAHPGWQSIEEAKAALLKAKGGE